MKLTILGSGGVNPPPRPTCYCQICEEARAKGIPYARTGCSMFVEDSNVLFDTPEEISGQLNRERIKQVDAVVLTHWHPDHTHGIRILEVLNWNFAEGKPFRAPIPVYISKFQHEMLTKYSAGSFLDYYVKKGMITVEYIEDKTPIHFGDVTVTPYLIDFTKGFYFLITDGMKKAVYLPCEYQNVMVDPEVRAIDTFIVHNLFWENPDISPRKNAPADEDTFEKMLTDADAMEAKKIILTHIEESFQLNHDDLAAKMKQYYDKYDIMPAYDGMTISL